MKALEEKEVPTVFVAMPFAPNFEDTYVVGMAEAAKATGFVCDRLDYEIFDDLVLNEMHARMHRCAGIIADLTEANPNVMYELGYTKVLQMPSVLICASPLEQLPFDVRGWQIVKYEFGQTAKLLKELIRRLEHLMSQIEERE